MDETSQKKLKVDVDFVVKVLVDADQLGDKYAAQTHGIVVRTVERYRQKYSKLPEVSVQVDALKIKLSEEFFDRASWTRVKLLMKVEQLSLASEDLHKVAGALKIVNDAVFAAKLITPEDVQRFKSRTGKAQSGSQSTEIHTRSEPRPDTATKH